MRDAARKNAVDLLRGALAGEEAGTRWLAAAALGLLGPEGKAACDALTDSLKDEDVYVRRQAAESLKKIKNRS